MSYQAIVCRILTRPHPNADKIKIGICQDHQVIVGLDIKDGDLGIFFDAGGQLHHEYCIQNNLYNNSSLAKLGLLPLERPGFFDLNRRVRAQTFRGTKSEGFWMPLSSLNWAGNTSKLKDGDTFVEFGGYEICTKYLSPRTKAALGKAHSQPKRENKCFPKHDVSKQLRFVINDIPDDSVLYVTEKLHGTQGRLAHVLDDIHIGGVKRSINRATKMIRIREPFPTKLYTYLDGSKNVILSKSEGSGWYGTNDFRYDVTKNIILHKGEAIYFEIVGWVNETIPIMPPHKVDKASLNEIRKQYGDTINYTYGCPAGEHRLYVYKIIQTNEDGYVVDLSWPQVKARCLELGIPHVPELTGPITVKEHYEKARIEFINAIVEPLTEGPSTLNPTQIREGVVVRVESSTGTMYLKAKGFSFKVLEGIIADSETYVDPEDLS